MLHGPLLYFIAGNGSARNRTAYLVAHGVGTVVVPAGARPEIATPGDHGEPATWQVIGGGDGYEVLRPPWRAPLAWHLPAHARADLTVPDERFRDVATSYVRDETVNRFATLAIGEAAREAAVRYPDGTTILVEARGLDGSRYLVVNENWDTTWRATLDGPPLSVERFGPNQIGVDLTGVTADASITLRHAWPRSAGVGLGLSLLAAPTGIALAIAGTRRHARRKRGGGA